MSGWSNSNNNHPNYGFAFNNQNLEPNLQPSFMPSAPNAGMPPYNPSGNPPTYFYPTQHFPIAGNVPGVPGPISATHFTTSFTPQLNTNVSNVPRWVHWKKGIAFPAHAIEAGFDSDGSPIYVGRFQHNGDLLPAKVIPQKHVAYVSYDGKEISSTSCEILCKENVYWVKCSNGQVPAGAIQIGHTASGEALYAARVRHKGSLTVGKVHPSHHTCYIPYGGNEISYRDYEILIG